ncbi:MAG TPA: hypothetical protein VFO83_16465 [Aggregicoccus sp.]|nr:hypothetical protein [Aggregicoccus sp.]
MADRRTKSTKRASKAPAQGALPESSRLPKRAASSPASRAVKKSATRPPRVSRTAGARVAEARALLGGSVGTPGAGGRTTGEGAGSTRRSRAPTADELAREAVRRERPQTGGGALRDFNLRTGRDVTALKQAARAKEAASPRGGRTTARTTKDKGGASLRTRR